MMNLAQLAMLGSRPRGLIQRGPYGGMSRPGMMNNDMGMRGGVTPGIVPPMGGSGGGMTPGIVPPMGGSGAERFPMGGMSKPAPMDSEQMSGAQGFQGLLQSLLGSGALSGSPMQGGTQAVDNGGGGPNVGPVGGSGSSVMATPMGRGGQNDMMTLLSRAMQARGPFARY